MSEFIRRAENAKRLIHDPTLPKWQRLVPALHAFSGFEITGLDDDAWKPFESRLASVNHLLAEYVLEEDKDYQNIDPADLRQVLEIIDEAASQAIAAELDRIVATLDAGDRELPVAAIREAREHRDLMIPWLIEVLKDATSAARAEEFADGDAPFYAIFLLAEFQAEEAFPAILEAFSLPGELPFDLFGDAVTDTWPKILAIFAGSRPGLLDTLIDDQALNVYVRWGAAQCYAYLVRDGKLKRDEAVHRLRQNLRQALDQSDETVIEGLIIELGQWAAREALEDIREAYRRGLVDSFMVDLGTIEGNISQGEDWVSEELERCPETRIEDTIEELKNWASFKEKPVPRYRPPPPMPRSTMDSQPAKSVAAAMATRGSRVGRNEPCPCGSGKKFKKCCGAYR